MAAIDPEPEEDLYEVPVARNTQHQSSSSSEDEATFGFGAPVRKKKASARSTKSSASYATPASDRPRWMHGTCTREVCERMLRARGVKQGQFLVRESSTSQADFVLSIRNGSRVVHCRIVRNHKSLYTLKICAERKFVDKDGNRGGPWFTTIVKVIDAFATKPIPNIWAPATKGRRPKGVTLSDPIDRPGYEVPASQASQDGPVYETAHPNEPTYQQWKAEQKETEDTNLKSMSAPHLSSMQTGLRMSLLAA